MSKLSTLRELLHFLSENKLYWITPIVIVLVLFGILFAFIGTSPVWSAFLYVF